MKISEALEIVGNLADWHLNAMGINPKTLKKIDYSLDQMIKANKIVENYDKRQMVKPGQKTMHVTLDDRLIAAQYVAMNFTADYCNQAEPKSGVNGKLVFVLCSTE